MIRNLKVLIVAAMALAALAAVSATGAQAAEFHCSLQPCTLTLKTDGTTTTAHHVFVVEGVSNNGTPHSTVSFTCPFLEGTATIATQPATVVTFDSLKYGEFGVAGKECKVFGEPFRVDTNGCKYTFIVAGKATLSGCTEGGIRLIIGGVTCVKIDNGVSAEKIVYHNIGEKSADTTEITGEVLNLPVLPTTSVTLENKENANCKWIVNLKSVEKATYTTGHTIVTAETDSGTPVMENAWFE